MQEKKLEMKLVGDINGSFSVPSYQRGYRWTSDEVIRMLDDIYYDRNDKYCLQPIVVKNKESEYEIIDGQQRLTTIYLIYHVMSEESNGFISEPKFTIKYETRTKSEMFLNTLDEEEKDNNIDYYFMYNAYMIIKNWFNKFADKKSSAITNVNKYFDEKVEVIWYETGLEEDSISLFERLNIGKIPLTSSELIKASFLIKRDEIEKAKQEEIALQWDTIEKELHDENFWAFLSNDNNSEYPTRIDLILNVLFNRYNNTVEKYFTFFEFEKEKQDINVETLWEKIYHTFLLFKDWYESHELYHKIGYLITQGNKSSILCNLFYKSKNKTKSEFSETINNEIKDSVNFDKKYGELSYETDSKKIFSILLLFNVMSVYQIDEKSQRFPFKNFKFSENNKEKWSLEHIHAQHSEGLKKLEEWEAWIKIHMNSVATISGNENLVEEMSNAIFYSKLNKQKFDEIEQKVSSVLSEKGAETYDIHRISNLALLSVKDNVVLSNSLFDVKRNKIVEKDKKGEYIPYCTKMVFLKYYTPFDKHKLHFWTQDDKDEYIKHINTVLKEFLSEEIVMKEEDYGNEII